MTPMLFQERYLTHSIGVYVNTFLCKARVVHIKLNPIKKVAQSGGSHYRCTRGVYASHRLLPTCTC